MLYYDGVLCSVFCYCDEDSNSNEQNGREITGRRENIEKKNGKKKNCRKMSWKSQGKYDHGRNEKIRSKMTWKRGKRNEWQEKKGKGRN